MKRERGAEIVPSDELVRLIHVQRGRLPSLRRVDGAQLLVPRPRARALAWARSWRAGAVLALAALIALGLVGRASLRSLSYTVEGARVARSGAIDVDGNAEAKVRFSDGSEVWLARGSRASLRRVDGRGARLALDSGKVHVDVTHRPDSRWLFDAGPFQVTVTGTAFTLGWADSDQRLDVNMERGSVEVRGPLSDGALSLRSGQHLIVRVRERETIIRDLDDGGPAAAAPASEGAEAARAEAPGVDHAAAARRIDENDEHVEPRAATATAPASAGRGGAPAGAPGREWGSLVAAGDFEAVVRDAQKHGFERCLAEASSADLASLADAARYGRHDDMARRTLLALRRRFPSSSAAHDAAFLLGRLEETDQRPGVAVDWFGRYVAESPGGTYASEALGRKMVLTQQTSGDADARALAVDYVRRFPQGTYAARARALIPAP
jgi:TolA-binding protein